MECIMDRAIERDLEVFFKRGQLRRGAKCSRCGGTQELRTDGDYVCGAVWHCLNCGREEQVF